MLAKMFEEQVLKRPHRICLNTNNQQFTYKQLNQDANRIAWNLLKILGNKKEEHKSQTLNVGLLFGKENQLFQAMVGVLKAGMTYIPLSIDYPINRLTYMIQHSDTSILLTHTNYRAWIIKITQQEIMPVECLYIDQELKKKVEPVGNPNQEIPGDQLAYIMYTSGSTGRPKGVKQTYENTIHFGLSWIEAFSITEKDRLSLFSSICHDGSLQDIWGALLSGAALFPLDMRGKDSNIDLTCFLISRRITICHLVPSLFNFFTHSLTPGITFPDIRYVALGGEPIREHEIRKFNQFFPGSVLANVYGQTESSVNSIRKIKPGEPFDYVTLGEPINRHTIFVLDEEGREVEEFETGEIMISSPHLSPGYWENEKETSHSFSYDPETGIQLYFTGDLGRLLPGAGIEYMGRKDSQVKIRGYRIETGEIESQLMQHPHIQGAVVTLYEKKEGDNQLCCYYTYQEAGPLSGQPVEKELREYLEKELPDYMIPLYFVKMETFPLTISGKIDRKALPKPVFQTSKSYIAPKTDIERSLVKQWARVLEIPPETIGIDDHFFQLGGHSLKALQLISRIHQQLEVKIPLKYIFKVPVIRGLAEYIKGKNHESYKGIPPAEKKEYYQLTSIQEQFFILTRMEEKGQAFHLIQPLILEGQVNRKRIELTFKRIIERHQSLRTAFRILEGGPVQIIFKQKGFQIQHFENKNNSNIKEIILQVRKPFNLSQSPLMRVTLTRLEKNSQLMIIETHHIVADGTSMTLILGEFIRLYNGDILPPLKIQYTDFSEWQKKEKITSQMKDQEKWWVDRFKRQLPKRTLFTDFPRPKKQEYKGERLFFAFEKELSKGLFQLAEQKEMTLYMIFLTAFNILLDRYTGEGDIITGTPIAGRNHVELEDQVGLFINVLPMRNSPKSQKTLKKFMEEVRENTLKCYENQDYPIGMLVEKLRISSNKDRHPLFDTELVVQNMAIPTLHTRDFQMKPLLFDTQVTQADISLFITEDQGIFYLNILYSTTLFKRETMTQFFEYFQEIVEFMIQCTDFTIKLGDIRLSHQLSAPSSKEYDEVKGDFQF
jgi:amino acid adenylation domain-containing protein